MKLRALSQAVLAASLVSGATLAQAEEEKGFEIAGNVAMVTDYRFRGISQTDDGPAIQGGFDIEHASGLYAGTWASNVELGGDGFTEFDFYVGYGGEITETVSFDVGFLTYQYPQSDEGSQSFDFNEWYASISAAGFTLGYAYSPDFFGGAGNAQYYSADYSVGLPSDIALDLHYGYQHVDADDYFVGPNAQPATSYYSEYSVGVSKDWAGVNWGLTWHDTTLSTNECFGSSSNCDSVVVFSVSKSL